MTDGPDDLDAVVAAIGDPAGWTIALDFDGTLSPLVDDPDAAAPAPGALEAVTALAASARVVVISGRMLEDLAPRVGDSPVDLIGGHGTQVRLGGEQPMSLTSDLAAPGALDAVLGNVEAELETVVDDAEGWAVERKPASVAVHYRRAAPDDRDETLAEVRGILDDAAGQPPGWDVLDGHDVAELRPQGSDKGVALAWYLDRIDGLSPVVIGDDVTDEDAFAVANDRGGISVLVAAAARQTAARWRIADPERVVLLLEALARA